MTFLRPITSLETKSGTDSDHADKVSLRAKLRVIAGRHSQNTQKLKNTNIS